MINYHIAIGLILRAMYKESCLSAVSNWLWRLHDICQYFSRFWFNRILISNYLRWYSFSAFSLWFLVKFVLSFCLSRFLESKCRIVTKFSFVVLNRQCPLLHILLYMLRANNRFITRISIVSSLDFWMMIYRIWNTREN